MNFVSNKLLESLSIIHYTEKNCDRKRFFKNAEGNYTDSISEVFSGLINSVIYRKVLKLIKSDRIYSFYDFICKKQFLNIHGKKSYEELYCLLEEFSCSKLFNDFINNWQKGFEYTENIALQAFSFFNNTDVIDKFLKLTDLNLNNYLKQKKYFFVPY